LTILLTIWDPRGGVLTLIDPHTAEKKWAVDGWLLHLVQR